ncbi:MAG: ABC transporter permease [Planctomycetes bacterium]|nr:ABC transporter permease [Planctomycetota bacterium]
MEPEAASGWRRLGRLEETGVLCALGALVLFFSLTTETFLGRTNLIQVARQASDYGLLAMAMVFVLTLGEVDLSVGSVMALVNVATAVALREGVPVVLAAALGLAAGAACGLANGALSVVLRIPSIIVTLGTMSVFRGLALVISKATPIGLGDAARESALLRSLGREYFHVPASVVAMLIAGILGHVVLQRTVFGRRVQAIGSNLQAARFSGIRIVRYRLAVMTLSGAAAGAAGLLALAFLEAGNPTTGETFELLAIASAVIGGTALGGGSGSVPGAALGALILAVISNGLVLLGLTAYWSKIVTGAMIVAAVAVDYLVKKLPQRER